MWEASLSDCTLFTAGGGLPRPPKNFGWESDSESVPPLYTASALRLASPVSPNEPLPISGVLGMCLACAREKVGGGSSLSVDEPLSEAAIVGRVMVRGPLRVAGGSLPGSSPSLLSVSEYPNPLPMIIMQNPCTTQIGALELEEGVRSACFLSSFSHSLSYPKCRCGRSGVKINAYFVGCGSPEFQN